jgi:hypothetical protein
MTSIEKSIRFGATFIIGGIPIAVKGFMLFIVNDERENVPPFSSQDILFFCLILCFSAF